MIMNYLTIDSGMGNCLAALMFLFPFVILMIWGILKVQEEERTWKRKQYVRESSKWYAAVLALNEEVHYHENILDNGNSEHFLSVNSKAKYDKTGTDVCLAEFVARYGSMVATALDQVRRNAVIYEMYDRKIASLYVEATAEQFEEGKMTAEEYQAVEQDVIREARLPICRAYSVNCHVSYTSPQGRNRYHKSQIYSEDEIRQEMERQERKSAYHASEVYRRRAERSRVTPSVRYRIMERDGFRCCVCGRSARSGVELEVDHIIPIARGGSSDDSNLQTLCRDCNRGKGATI